MASRTSRTDQRVRRSAERGRFNAAGYTLVESMIASALLSVCVVGVSGTVLSSYAHDVHSKQQHDAVRAAESLKNELTALPMEAASAGDVGLMDFANYSDTAAADQNLVASAAKEEEKQVASGTSGSTGLIGGVVNVVGGLLGGLLGGSSSGGSTTATPTATPTPTSTVEIAKTATLATASGKASRVVHVERRATLNGSVTPTGELAFITVDVSVGQGQTVRLKRLLSTTEAASNANGGGTP